MDKNMDFAPCGYVTLTTQGVIKEANHTFLEMTGYRDKDLIEMHFESFLSVASKIMFHSLFFPQIRLNGQIEELYLTFKKKNSDEMSVLLIGSKSGNGSSENIDCVIVKTGKRDDYEEELQNIKKKLEEAYLMESKLRKLFETTLFSINEGLIVTDSCGVITIINDLALKYTGWSREAALGKSFDEVFSSVNSKTLERKSDIIKPILSAEKSKDIFNELILVSRNSTQRYVSGAVAAIVSGEGKVSGVVSSFRDITKEYIQEKEIENFLNVNMEMLCVIDEKGNFHKLNKKFENTLGYTAEELAGKSFLSYVHQKDISDTSKAIGASLNSDELSVFTNRYQCKDGTYKYIEWYRQPVAGKYIYSSARDVTEKMEKEEQLVKIAVKDELTGLYNRHFLASYLDNVIGKAEAEGPQFTLAILDLDHFKLVNDTWGHPIGDEQLKHTAKIISGILRSTDLLVRFGGEEFVIILSATTINAAKIVLDKVRSAIEKNQYPVTGRQTVSIGAAEWCKSESFADCYKRADEALYRAKERGRNCVMSA